MDCDVLICGGGPVGQLLAVHLGLLGVRALVVDAGPGVYELPRAAVVDDEVLRICQAVGLDADVLAGAQVQDGASYVTAGGRPVRILDAAAGVLGQPPLVSIHQPTLERAFVRALGARPEVEVRWETTVEAIVSGADDVRVELRPTGGGRTRSVRARWVVACDGAGSVTRARMGVAFGGSTFVQRWLVVDATVDRPLARVPHPLFVGDRERPTVTLPMSPGRHRWEWMIRPTEDASGFLDRDAIRARMAPWLSGEQAEVERAVVYTFHARQAARWRAGRVLLAGDAAHVMPPFVGQGFSSGARDVANLAWKLDAVVRGAPDALLDTYEIERRPHVSAMQNLAVRWGGVLQTTRPGIARLRDRLMDAYGGSAIQAWANAHAKPLPTYGAGAFAARPNRVPPKRTIGALFPQPQVRDAAGADVRLDDVLPRGWALLTRDPAVALAGVPVRRIGATPERSGHEARRASADLSDVTGALGAWLDRARADWVLLRPDRFVFACGHRGDLAEAAVARTRFLGVAA